MDDIQSLEEGRASVAASFVDESQTFEPQDIDIWKAALAKWRSICR